MPRALRELAEINGMDPIAQLYNEALQYANEGHPRLARERLQMLLCMSPDDAEARLLLSRIFAAGRRWQEAQKELDEAAKYGAEIPQNLRHAIDEHFRLAQREESDRREVVRERDEIELCSLRGQVKSLRSENAVFQSDVRRLQSDVRRWAWATLGVALLGIGLWAGSLLVVGESTPIEAPTVAADVAPVAPAAPALAAPAEVVPATPTKPAAASTTIPAQPATAAALPSELLKRDALAALDRSPGLNGHGVTVGLQGSQVVATGHVLHYTQLMLAERTLAAIDGVDGVDVSGVEVLSRTQGTTHVVASGDTLGAIAQRYYGSSAHGDIIAQANDASPKRLQLGQKLDVPPMP